MKIFEWHKIEHKNELLTGTAKLKCPECNDARKNKADRPLYVRYDSGIAKCFHCEGLSFRDSIEKETIKTYKIPAQDWKNYTKLSDKVVKYFEQRGIKQFTLHEFEISEEQFYQPQLQKTVNNIVFNFFEGEVLVNKKYRSSQKTFMQSKDTKSIFYNINSVIGQKEAYIVEGEIDCLTLHQEGFKSVISVPNGANDNDAYWINSEPYMKDIQKFYIATDNDAKGNELADKIAQRLGRYRCERVNFIGKDANEDLVNGHLKESIFNTTKYPVSGTFTANDLHDKLISLYDDGLPPVIYPLNKSFGENVRDVFTVMRGHLVTVTGIPSHGKSNFTEWYVLNLVNDYGMKASFFSPEHTPMELHQSTFVEKFHAKNYWKEVSGTPRINKIEIAQYTEWANEKIYLTSPEDGKIATWEWILEKFKEQMFNFGVDIFVIDAYNKVEHTGNRSERERISDVLTKLTSFAQQNNVIIFLVAHPTKMQKNDDGTYKIPDLYSVSGSADFRNQTHDGYCIYRYFGNEKYVLFVNLKTKMKFQGEIGSKIEYDYHLPSGRYYERGTEPDLFPLNYIKKKYKEPEEIENKLPTPSISEAFDVPDYNPNAEILF